MHRIAVSLALLALLLVPLSAPRSASAQVDPVPQVMDWSTDSAAGTVHFQIRWMNLDRQSSSNPVVGQVAAQDFGVFTPDSGPIGSFEVPPLAPDSFFDVFFDVPLASLPPSATEILPGGGGLPTAPGVLALADSTICNPDDHWDGNVDVTWSGAAGGGQVNVHYGTLQVCPGAGASYIHVRGFYCNGGDLPWQFTDICPGFNPTLVNEDFTPAPAILPPGWSGWICLTADPTVPIGLECCMKLVVTCNGVPATIDLCVSTCDWATPFPTPVLSVPDWTVDAATGIVTFQLHWSNPDLNSASTPVSGQVSSQEFGVFQSNFGPIGTFNVPSLAPDSFFDIFYDVALADLPAPPQELLPGGGPGAPGVLGLADSTLCPPDDHWDGNVDVEWNVNGVPAQVNVHYGSLLLCPGGGASYIHIPFLGCASPIGITWSIVDLCPGFTGTLVNEDFTPAPAVLPPGWSGWICMQADASVTVGTECCPRVLFDCDGVPAEITLCTHTCDWSTSAPVDPTVSVPDWTFDPATGVVTFQLHWTNTDPTLTSSAVSGEVRSQQFGVFQPDFGPIGAFNVPPLAPDSFFDIFFDVALGDLPPPPQEVLPGGGPNAPGVLDLAQGQSCPPDDHWDGNVDVVWTGSSPGQVNVHYGSILVNPGAGASYIHVPFLGCQSAVGVTWQIADVCPGYTVALVNEDYSAAPAVLGSGWSGWICIAADASVPAGQECCPTVTFDCDGQPGTITLCSTTCSWAVLGLPGPDGHPAMALQARPNPTVGSTMLSYSAPVAGPARVEIFDMAGRLVRNVFAGDVPAGFGSVTWDGRGEQGNTLPSGVYFARFTTGGRTISQKVLLVK